MTKGRRAVIVAILLGALWGSIAYQRSPQAQVGGETSGNVRSNAITGNVVDPANPSPVPLTPCGALQAVHSIACDAALLMLAGS